MLLHQPHLLRLVTMIVALGLTCALSGRMPSAARTHTGSHPAVTAEARALLLFAGTAPCGDATMAVKAPSLVPLSTRPDRVVADTCLLRAAPLAKATKLRARFSAPPLVGMVELRL